MISKLLKFAKLFVMGCIVLLIASFMWSKIKQWVWGPKTGATGEVLQSTSFQDTDAVLYTPLKHSVTHIESDKTLDALLSGKLGPCVVMVFAEWCSHCRNMMDAFESAAKTSGVPFVRVPGSSAPISMKKYDVRGYPTVFGVNTVGMPKKYNGMRTPDGLLEFASFLVPVLQDAVPVAKVLEPAKVVVNSLPVPESAGLSQIGIDVVVPTTITENAST